MKHPMIAAGCAIAGAAGYAVWVRPWHLRWGTREPELGRVWPGDEFMPSPLTQATRAVTIHAPAECVWPWVAQIGQDRGGFYSYTPLENMFGAGMRNAGKIHAEWPGREIGEKVWLGSPKRFDGKAHLIVARLVPGRAMVLVTPDDWDRIRAARAATQTVWSFVVEPIDTKSSRLIARTLCGSGMPVAQKVANYVFWEPAHFVMERGMLLGIKRRAEAETSSAHQAGVRHIFRAGKEIVI